MAVSDLASKGRLFRWASPRERRKRATACANISWTMPTERNREVALMRVHNAWLDGYESAMRDARKGQR